MKQCFMFQANMLRIDKAIKILKDGGIVIFPTDTAFGIGCRIDDEKAVERVFKIRKRPHSQATPVLIDSIKMVQGYVQSVPEEVIDKLIKPYWPGGLTLILYCNKVKVPSLVRGGGETLGIRMPNHAIAREIIRGVGVPILGPSANFHGKKTPYRIEDLDKKLVKLVDCVVVGKCILRQQSTVIDCSEKPWRIVREGAVEIQNSKVKNQNHNSKLKNNPVLIIDTTSNKEVAVGVGINGKENWIKQKIDAQKAQVVLSLIDKLIKKKNLKITGMDRIKVNVKHGSFTGVRVGLAVANALSFALKIPVEKVQFD